MPDVVYRSDVTVELADSMGGDKRICDVARVLEPQAWGTDLYPADRGLMNMLMRDRHGTPWEHVVLTFYIAAPIMVAREAHRHRIASINEESGRYKQLEGVFYVPGDDRPLRQTGKPGAYTFAPGTYEQQRMTQGEIRRVSKESYSAYQRLLDAGVAREIARSVLPVNVFTSWVLTINLRSLMNFLSLRAVNDRTTVPTFPQQEIQMVAQRMEELAQSVAPEALRLFNEYGRLAP